jgi:hypothetical protein
LCCKAADSVWSCCCNWLFRTLHWQVGDLRLRLIKLFLQFRIRFADRLQLWIVNSRA